MSDPTRTATAVTFLVADRGAQRMALSWPLLDPDLVGTALLRTWAQAAGVPVSHARRLARVLRTHEICRDDHTLCPEASRVLQHVAAEALRSAKRAKR